MRLQALDLSAGLDAARRYSGDEDIGMAGSMGSAGRVGGKAMRRLRQVFSSSCSFASGQAQQTLVDIGLGGFIAAIGLAGPRWGMAGRTTESRALNVVLVIDVSKSMLAPDASPSRLLRATGPLGTALSYAVDPRPSLRK